MYIIELLEKLMSSSGQKNKTEEHTEEKEYEKCEHIFVPVDSTGNILACNKCGLTVKKNKLTKKNFFEK